ncbi:hypothetical protein H072_1236 [Dactylellina haptotyla CBS 200.50]|uniref:Uncharacterized protein n=1 Tax=Dactylellina haptotyla (strain CBS 200.50) TaxID=1284197 RepID=S8AV35_DACHA|nr:hypothetical protein H072_1236 [Dactylellina haptotyla CBS 200.50]
MSDSWDQPRPRLASRKPEPLLPADVNDITSESKDGTEPEAKLATKHTATMIQGSSRPRWSMEDVYLRDILAPRQSCQGLQEKLNKKQLEGCISTSRNIRTGRYRCIIRVRKISRMIGWKTLKGYGNTPQRAIDAAVDEWLEKLDDLFPW